MHNLTNYIVESSVALAILTTYYMLALHNTSNLTFKRIYLMLTLLFAAAIPVLNFNAFVGADSMMSQPNNALVVLQTITVLAGNLSSEATPIVKTHSGLSVLYFLGFIVLFVRFSIGLVRIGLMGNLFYSTKIAGFRLFTTGGNYNPFSFFRWVFIPTSLWENETGKIILQHEQAHSYQWHSIDIVILELVLVVQWFNPFAWIIRREIKYNHEFLADRAVLGSGTEMSDYLRSMLFQSFKTRFEIANNFSLSITKKRIKMMKTQNIKSQIVVKSLFSLLLAALLTFTFACESNPSKTDSVDLGDNQKAVSIDDQVFFVVEEMPKYVGGGDSLMQFLKREVRYPDEAMKNDVEGRVMVSFVIDVTGKVGSVQIEKSVHPLLDGEAIRVAESMPNWIPGKQRGKAVSVKYVLPIQFKLDNSAVVVDNVAVAASKFDCKYKVKTNNDGTKTINGTICAKAGKAIQGVSVICANQQKGYAGGTVSDGDGQFALKIPANTSEIVLSFVGMETQRIKIQ